MERRAADALPAHLQAARPAARGRLHRRTRSSQAIVSNRASVGIVTLAPEMPGGTRSGPRPGDGRSSRVARPHRRDLRRGARGDRAGAHHATHLFNRMSSITSRSPGVVGAVLESDAVAAEIICDGHHVHPSLVAMAIRLKSASRMMAITDATAAAGLPVGARARLGDQTIIAGETHRGARGRHARRQHPDHGCGVPDAGRPRSACRSPTPSRMCATTPAEAIRACATSASIAAGKWADLAVLSRDLRVGQTYMAGAP